MDSDMDNRVATGKKLTIVDYIDIASGPIIIVMLLIGLLAFLL